MGPVPDSRVDALSCSQVYDEKPLTYMANPATGRKVVSVSCVLLRRAVPCCVVLCHAVHLLVAKIKRLKLHRLKETYAEPDSCSCVCAGPPGRPLLV
jgi:hypothetical protein